jgi:hypothetical protein
MRRTILAAILALLVLSRAGLQVSAAPTQSTDFSAFAGMYYHHGLYVQVYPNGYVETTDTLGHPNSPSSSSFWLTYHSYNTAYAPEQSPDGLTMFTLLPYGMAVLTTGGTGGVILCGYYDGKDGPPPDFLPAAGLCGT